MKLIRIVPLAVCYLMLCGCSAEAHNHDHDHDHNHEHSHEGHDHDHDHDHDHGDHDHDHSKDKATSKPSADQPAKKTVKLDSKKFDHFGAGAHAGDTLTPSALVANAVDYGGKPVLVKGKVSSVCKNRGCWLRVTDDKTELFVKATCGEWGVPKDSEGREAIVEGTFSVTTQSVAEQKHLLEDAGKHEEAARITEPKTSYQVQAVGVAMVKLDPKK